MNCSLETICLIIPPSCLPPISPDTLWQVDLQRRSTEPGELLKELQRSLRAPESPTESW